MQKKKIYIAGAISNNPNYKKNFMEKEQELLSRGYIVINPVENEGFSYKDYIDIGLAKLSKCDAIYLLNGWVHSEGARLEQHYAVTTGMSLMYEEDEE